MTYVLKVLVALALLQATLAHSLHAAEPAKGKSPTPAQVAACEKVRKDVADGKSAETNTSGTIAAGGAVAGVAGILIGAAISAGINASNAEQAYQDCLAGKSVHKASTGNTSTASAKTSASPQSSSSKGLGACVNNPKSCSEARGMCYQVCAAKNAGGRCSAGCSEKFQNCKGDGVWAAQNCTLTGLAQR